MPAAAASLRNETDSMSLGADPKFLIRGGSSINQSNDPIVLVDGVVREMAGLNPNDIESVSFLKDCLLYTSPRDRARACTAW